MDHSFMPALVHLFNWLCFPFCDEHRSGVSDSSGCAYVLIFTFRWRCACRLRRTLPVRNLLCHHARVVTRWDGRVVVVERERVSSLLQWQMLPTISYESSYLGKYFCVWIEYFSRTLQVYPGESNQYEFPYQFCRAWHPSLR